VGPWVLRGKLAVSWWPYESRWRSNPVDTDRAVSEGRSVGFETGGSGGRGIHVRRWVTRQRSSWAIDRRQGESVEAAAAGGYQRACEMKTCRLGLTIELAVDEVRGLTVCAEKGFGTAWATVRCGSWPGAIFSVRVSDRGA
jgi:hypothetical protein